jgi:hypothetical protein
LLPLVLVLVLVLPLPLVLPMRRSLGTLRNWFRRSTATLAVCRQVVHTH